MMSFFFDHEQEAVSASWPTGCWAEYHPLARLRPPEGLAALQPIQAQSA